MTPVQIIQMIGVGASVMLAAICAIGHRIHQELLVKELLLEDFVENGFHR